MKKRVTMNSIIQAVCTHYDVLPDDLTGRSRALAIARPRQMAFKLCYELTPRSYPEIGERFGGRDHSTVIHGHHVMNKLVDTDTHVRRDFDRLRRALGLLSSEPANDNETTAEADEKRRAFFKECAARRRKKRMDRIRPYLDLRKEREFQRRLSEMDEMDFMSWRVAQYAARPLAERMAE